MFHVDLIIVVIIMDTVYAHCGCVYQVLQNLSEDR